MAKKGRRIAKRKARASMAPAATEASDNVIQFPRPSASPSIEPPAAEAKVEPTETAEAPAEASAQTPAAAPAERPAASTSTAVGTPSMPSPDPAAQAAAAKAAESDFYADEPLKWASASGELSSPSMPVPAAPPEPAPPQRMETPPPAPATRAEPPPPAANVPDTSVAAAAPLPQTAPAQPEAGAEATKAAQAKADAPAEPELDVPAPTADTAAHAAARASEFPAAHRPIVEDPPPAPEPAPEPEETVVVSPAADEVRAEDAKTDEWERDVESQEAAPEPEPPAEVAADDDGADRQSVADTGEQGVVQEVFFSSAEELGKVEDEGWDDIEKSVLPPNPSMARARYATFAILAVGLLLTGGWWFVQNVWYPAGAELAENHTPSMPGEIDLDGASDGEGAAAAEGAEARTEGEQAAEGEAAEGEAAEGEEGAEAETAEGETAEGETAEGETAEGETAEGEELAEGDIAEDLEAVHHAEEAVAAAEAGEAGPADMATYDDFMQAAGRAGTRRNLRDEALEEAIAANPNGVEALSQLALSHVEAGRHLEDAERYAARAVGLDPSNTLAWFTLGAARQQLGNNDGAREAYTSCIENGSGSWALECRGNRNMLPRR